MFTQLRYERELESTLNLIKEMETTNISDYLAKRTFLKGSKALNLAYAEYRRLPSDFKN